MPEKAKQLGNEPVQNATYIKDNNIVLTGLTIRQYFAGLAMQGLLAQENFEDPENTANNAVCYADALLEELSK
jgi:hypothetical protein